MYVPPRKPTETEEQFQRRVRAGVLADKMRVQAGQSAKAMRMIRLVFLVICGLVLTGIGIYNFNDPGEMSNTQGFGNEHFGPHGNAISWIVTGLLILGLSGYFLLRQIRRIRAGSTNEPPMV